MVNPVPGHGVSTPYRKTSTGSWKTCGWHTGQDYAAPAGTDVVAARGGTVAHVDHGSDLGEHQFVIRPGDGTEDMYCHTSTRPAHGAVVAAGQKVADVSDEGNATGHHLHFERHTAYGWACGTMDDPMKSHNAGASAPPSGGGYPAPTSGEVRLSKLRIGTQDSDSVWYLQRALNGHSLMAPGNITLDLVGDYGPLTDQVVRADQTQHGFGLDPEGASFVGSQQAAHLFAGSGLRIINDL